MLRKREIFLRLVMEEDMEEKEKEKAAIKIPKRKK